MSSVGGVGGAGGAGGGAVGAAGGASAGGSAGAAAGAGAVGAVGAVGGDSGGDTSAAEMVGAGVGESSNITANTGMSTQDWSQLRTQAAQPPQEAPEMDLNKMLEWLMAIKLLEAANKGK